VDCRTPTATSTSATSEPTSAAATCTGARSNDSGRRPRSSPAPICTGPRRGQRRAGRGLPEQFALDWHEQYAATFPKFNVEFDNYGHTHDETNTAVTQQLVRDLDEGGHLYEKEIMVAYDPVDDQFLPDRYVEGTCPYYCVRTPAATTSATRGASATSNPARSRTPNRRSPVTPPSTASAPTSFFEVSAFSEYLTGFLDRLEGTSNARNQPREWIEQGLQDWCITRDMDWGSTTPAKTRRTSSYTSGSTPRSSTSRRRSSTPSASAPTLSTGRPRGRRARATRTPRAARSST